MPPFRVGGCQVQQCHATPGTQGAGWGCPRHAAGTWRRAGGQGCWPGPWGTVLRVAGGHQALLRHCQGMPIRSRACTEGSGHLSAADSFSSLTYLCKSSRVSGQLLPSCRHLHPQPAHNTAEAGRRTARQQGTYGEAIRNKRLTGSRGRAGGQLLPCLACINTPPAVMNCSRRQIGTDHPQITNVKIRYSLMAGVKVRE